MLGDSTYYCGGRLLSGKGRRAQTPEDKSPARSPTEFHFDDYGVTQACDRTSVLSVAFEVRLIGAVFEVKKEIRLNPPNSGSKVA